MSPRSSGWLRHCSQGSVATQLRCGRIFNNHVIANFPQSVPVVEFLRSVSIWRKYRQKYSRMLTGYVVNTYTVQVSPWQWRRGHNGACVYQCSDCIHANDELSWSSGVRFCLPHHVITLALHTTSAWYTYFTFKFLYLNQLTYIWHMTSLVSINSFGLAVQPFSWCHFWEMQLVIDI